MPKYSPSEDTVPLLEERAVVHKVQKETGRTRVRLVSTEQERIIDEEVTATHADIVRVPVGRIVDEAPEPHWEGDVYVVPVLEEVLVTEKKLRLVEEVHIRRLTTTGRVSHPVTLRRSEVVIERVGPADNSPNPGELE